MIMLVVLLTMGLVAVAAAGHGPAPRSHDGVSDGSGLEAPFGLSGGVGPAPNAGDGIPDGSGF